MIDDFLDGQIKGTEKRLSALNRVIFDTIFNYLSDNLTFSDDSIKYTQSNVGIIEALSKEVRKLDGTIGKLGKYILSGINKLIGLTANDLKKVDKRAVKSGQRVSQLLMNHAKTNIGTNLQLEGIFAEFKERALRQLSKPTGIGLKDLRTNLEGYVLDGKVSEKYFARWSGDIYSQYQRAAANEIRKELKLKHAVYAGGLIETSRPFCQERNGNTYTEDEIAEWENEDFEGKSDPYDPFIDCGGYNCRHRLDWISEEMYDTIQSENEEP